MAVLISLLIVSPNSDLPRGSERSRVMGLLYDLDPMVITVADILFSTAGMIGAIWIVARWDPMARRD